MKTFHTFSSLSLSHDNGQVLTVLEFPGSDLWVWLLHGHVGRLRDPPDNQDSQVGVGVVDNVVDGGVGDAVDEDGDPKKVNLKKIILKPQLLPAHTSLWTSHSRWCLGCSLRGGHTNLRRILSSTLSLPSRHHHHLHQQQHQQHERHHHTKVEGWQPSQVLPLLAGLKMCLLSECALD